MSVGKSIKHDSSLFHVTGESVFIDDLPKVAGEIFVGYVGSPIACGKLVDIDFSKALEKRGILGVLTAKDFTNNLWGTIVKEQPLLVDNVISHMDEPVALIVGKSREDVDNARDFIKIKTIEKTPQFSIDDAILNKDFCYIASPFHRGNPEKAFEDSDHILEGYFECGGQEHFYLESQASIAIPGEGGQMMIYSSSQHPSETQHVVANALGLSYHQVTCVVKRMGGGFGGKESQAAPFAAYAALAARKFNKPCRIILTKDEDMAVTGKRHPFKNFYKVGFNKDGRINVLEAKLYSDAGAFSDLSSSILERAMFHIDGAYFLENCHIEGYACRTNRLSNTAFRGFGGPQGTMTIESIIEDIAHHLKKDSFEIRKLNLYGIGERDITPFGQKVLHNKLPEIFSKLEKEYEKKKVEVQKHNKNNELTFRGISCTAVKFGIAFTAKFLNQGSALVNVHLDGTVQVSTGATEMGQGVNTKIQQIVAHAFGIDATDVQVMSTSTEKNHNTSPTAASSGSDINGSAAFKASNEIKKRLQIVAHKHFEGERFDDVKEYEIDDVAIDFDRYVFDDGKVFDSQNMKKSISFKELVGMAYFNRISLGQQSFYKTPDLGFSKDKGEGKAFSYFTNGAALSVVDIDRFTGESKVLSTSIVMDLGRSINPGIDEGQVTGAFIQGMGWVTNEKLHYSDKGNLISHSPTTYKIPNIQDMPREFNVELIENLEHDRNIHRSKAVGEPPFLLGSSVWCAIKSAILNEYGDGHKSKLTSPATSEKIITQVNRLS